MARPGLLGAHLTIGDAERAFAITSSETQVVHFSTDWHAAIVRQSGDRLGALLQQGSATARAHPHLAEAVTAFAEGGFSVAEAARGISLHPNTVDYRLNRWRALTGWEPRSFRGLVNSLASIASFDPYEAAD